MGEMSGNHKMRMCNMCKRTVLRNHDK